MTGVVRRTCRWLTLAAFLAPGVSPAAPGPLRHSRMHDPVTLDTRALAALSDRDPTHYRLYARRDGVLAPIPFQVDVRDARGGYVLDGDEAGVGRPFDGDDELVFMAKDTGERAAPGMLAGGGPAVELEVADVATGARGWAYLVHDPIAAGPTGESYATYDRVRHEVRAGSYGVRYPAGSNFLTGFTLRDAAGGARRPLVERMSLLIEPTFSMLLTRWTARLTEDSFATEIEGVRNGPVRAIVRARQSLDLGRLLPDAPAGDVLTFYYAGAIVSPSQFEIPGLVLRLLRDFRFEGNAVLDATAALGRYVDAAHPDGLLLATGPRGALPGDDPDWFVIDGPSGAYLHTLSIPESWRRWGISRGTVIRETPERRLAAGYSLRHMTRLREPGVYDLRASMVVLEHPYRPGDEEPALAMLHRPLVVHVRDVRAAAR